MTWCIAGHGKVAGALAKRLTERGVAFEQVSARGWATGNDLPSTDCRALFLALPDDVISEAAVASGGCLTQTIRSFTAAVQRPCRP